MPSSGPGLWRLTGRWPAPARARRTSRRRGRRPLSGCLSRLVLQARESFFQIGDQITRIFQTGMDAQDRSFGGNGFGCAMDVTGEDQAFKAAPGIADAEMLQAVYQARDGLFRHGLQFESEQSRSPPEVPLPNGMAGIVRERRIKNAH